MKIFLLIATLLAGAGTWSAQAADRGVFQEAEARFRAQEWELALNRYDALIRQHPSSPTVPDAQFRRAVVLYRLGRYQEAVRVFRRVESRFRSTQYLPEVPFWKGLARYQLQDYSAAVSDLDSFLDDHPDSPLRTQALLYRALAEIGSERPMLARATLETLFSETPDAGEESYAAALLTSLYIEHDDTELILRFTDELNLSDIESPWRENVKLYRAEALRAEGRSEEAFELYDAVVDAAPEIARVALQRRFERAQQTGDRDRVDGVLLEAEQRLAGRPELLSDFWLQVGIDAYEREEYEIAELYLRRVWDLRGAQPITGLVPLYLSHLRERRGELARAAEILELYLAEEDEPDEHARVLMRLGAVRLAQENWEAATERFGEVVSQYPDSEHFGKAAYQLAFAEYRLGDLAAARNTIARTLGTARAGAFMPELLRLRASVERDRGELEDAVATFRDYLPMRSDDVASRLEYHKLLFRTGRTEQLVLESREFAESHPEFSEPVEPGYNAGTAIEFNYLKGIALVSRRNYREASEVLGRLPETPEEYEQHREIYPYVLYYRGWSAYQRAEYDEAVGLFDELVSYDQEHEFAARAAYLAGWSAFQQGAYDAAEERLLRVSALHASRELRIEAAFVLGQALAARGSHQEAAVQFRNLYLDYPDSGYADDARFEYAAQLAALERVDEAVAAYREVYERFPDSPLAEQALYTSGELLLSDGRYDDARNAFADYRNSFPDGRLVGAALYWGGDASYRLGESSGALLLWERLLEQHRDSEFRAQAMERAAEIYRDRREYRDALNLLTQLIVAYPERAEEIDARSTADQLVLLIGGLSQREAGLWVRIENNDRARSDAGREAIIELAQLVFYETAAGPRELGIVLPLLRETMEYDEEDPERAALAAFMLAEHSGEQGEYARAAERFLEAAAINPADTDHVARSLYRSAEMQLRAGRRAEAEAIKSELEDEFPNSEWTAEARRLLGES